MGSADPVSLDHVSIRQDKVPSDLQAGRFLETMIRAVLDRTPIDFHVRARELWRGESLQVGEADHV